MVTYNWIKNARAESMTFAFVDSKGAPYHLYVGYNVIQNAGYGWGPTRGAIHGDWVQISRLVR